MFADAIDVTIPSYAPPFVDGVWYAKDWVIRSPDDRGISLMYAGGWNVTGLPVPPVGTNPPVFYEIRTDHRIGFWPIRVDASPGGSIYLPVRELTLRACIAGGSSGLAAAAGNVYQFRWSAAPSQGGPKGDAVYSSGPRSVAAGASSVPTPIPKGARSVYIALTSNTSYGSVIFRSVAALDDVTTVISETVNSNRQIVVDGLSRTYSIQNVSAAPIAFTAIWRLFL